MCSRPFPHERVGFAWARNYCNTDIVLGGHPSYYNLIEFFFVFFFWGGGPFFGLLC